MRIVKITISLFLIQSFLTLNLAYCGTGQLIERNQSRDTLSPKVAISSENLSAIIINMVNILGADGVNKIPDYVSPDAVPGLENEIKDLEDEIDRLKNENKLLHADKIKALESRLNVLKVHLFLAKYGPLVDSKNKDKEPTDPENYNDRELELADNSSDDLAKIFNEILNSKAMNKVDILIGLSNAIDNVMFKRKLTSAEVQILIAGLKGWYDMNAFVLGRIELVQLLFKILAHHEILLDASNTQKIIIALNDFLGINGKEKADPQLNEIMRNLGGPAYAMLLKEIEENIMQNKQSTIEEANETEGIAVLGGNRQGGNVEMNFTDKAWIHAGEFAYKIMEVKGQVFFQRYDKKDGKALGGIYFYQSGDEIKVGRNDANDYSNNDELLSGDHFAIKVELNSNGEHKIIVKDNNSLNGTVVEVINKETKEKQKENKKRDSADQNVVDYNAARIFSEEFMFLLFGESIGGNAGMGHAGINGAVDKNGKIILFGNDQNYPANIKQALIDREAFSFAIRVNANHFLFGEGSPEYELFIEEESKMSKQARNNLQQAVNKANEMIEKKKSSDEKEQKTTKQKEWEQWEPTEERFPIGIISQVRNWEKITDINLKDLPEGTLIYLGENGLGIEYLIRVEKEGKIKLWLNRSNGAYEGNFDSLGTGNVKTGEHYKGELKAEGIIGFPYFRWKDGHLLDMKNRSPGNSSWMQGFPHFRIRYPDGKNTGWEKTKLGGDKKGGSLARKFSGEAWIQAGDYSYKLWVENEIVMFQRYDENKTKALGSIHRVAMSENFSVGRGRKNDYILSEDGALSGRHFTVKIDPTPFNALPGVYDLKIRDNDSTNGTNVEYKVESYQDKQETVKTTESKKPGVKLEDVQIEKSPKQQLQEAVQNETIPDRVVVIGDIHAQEDKLGKILERAGVIVDADSDDWELKDDFKNGNERVVMLGDIIHGENEYKGEEAQLRLIKKVMKLQEQINGRDKEGQINHNGHFMVLQGNHEKAELFRIAHNKTNIFKGRIPGMGPHQGISPQGEYRLPEDVKEWIENMPASYQLGGLDFAHAGPFERIDDYKRNWFNKEKEVKAEYKKKNVVFGLYGHTPYAERGMEGSEQQVRLAAGGQAAILDVNRHVTGFAEIKRDNNKWKIFENIDGKERLLTEKEIPKIDGIIRNMKNYNQNLKFQQDLIRQAI